MLDAVKQAGVAVAVVLTVGVGVAQAGDGEPTDAGGADVVAKEVDGGPPVGDAVLVTLTDGEVIRGTLLERDGERLTVAHEVFGELEIALDSVLAIEPVPGDAAGATIEAVEPEPEPEAKPTPRKWSGSAEVGVNGSQGNQEQTTIRIGGALKRRTSRNVSTADATFTRAPNADGENQSQVLANLGNDFLFRDSRWLLFARAGAEYDEAKAFDLRLAGNAGPGYRFIATDATTLTGRLGFGASREFGGDNDKVSPEAVVATDFAQQISERQQLTANFEIFPDLRDTGEFRSLAKAAYQIVVSEEMNLHLSLGVEDRYDSTPVDGNKENDLDYFTTLGWKF